MLKSGDNTPMDSSEFFYRLLIAAIIEIAKYVASRVKRPEPPRS